MTSRPGLPSATDRPWRRFLREEDGNETLEVALVFPVFLMFTYGLLQMLLFLYCYVAATYGSRAAVRYAAQHGVSSLTPCSQTDLLNIVRSYAAVLPSSNVVITTPNWTPGTATVGSTVIVQVQLSYSTVRAVSGFSTLSVTTTASGVILQ